MIALGWISPDEDCEEGLAGRCSIALSERHVRKQVGHPGAVHAIGESKCSAAQIADCTLAIAGCPADPSPLFQTYRRGFVVASPNCAADRPGEAGRRVGGDDGLPDRSEARHRSRRSIQVPRCTIRRERPLPVAQLAGNTPGMQRDVCLVRSQDAGEGESGVGLGKTTGLYMAGIPHQMLRYPTLNITTCEAE